MKKTLCRFLYFKNMTYFEAFHWGIKLRLNLLFLDFFFLALTIVGQKWAIIINCHEDHTIATKTIQLPQRPYNCHEDHTIATKAIYNIHKCNTINHKSDFC